MTEVNRELLEQEHLTHFIREKIKGNKIKKRRKKRRIIYPQNTL